MLKLKTLKLAMLVENFKVCFFRPLSTLTHWVDYLLWPDAPILMHLQSLMWFGILVLLTALLPRAGCHLVWRELGGVTCSQANRMCWL